MSAIVSELERVQLRMSTDQPRTFTPAAGTDDPPKNSLTDETPVQRPGSRKPRPFSSYEALRHAVSNLNRLDDFQCEPIGAGFFSEVFKVKHRTTGAVMVLKMNLLASNRSNMLREVELMNQLSHPNILRFIGVCVHGGQLHALTEYINGGSLEQLISSSEELPWKLRIQLALDMAKGLRYLHSKGFFHRDLTSKNVLIQRDDVTGALTAVVGDFGLAAKIPDSQALYRLPTVGSPYWMSPECLRGEWYDERSDIFSYGIILCELIARISADPDVMPRTHNFGLDYLLFSEMCPNCPPKFLELAFSCCHMDPSKRPSLDAIVQHLESLLQSDGDPRDPCPALKSRPSKEDVMKSAFRLDDVYLVAGKSPSEKARCRYVNVCLDSCHARAGSPCRPTDSLLTTKHIGQAMSQGDPYYTPSNTALNPFATLKRFKHGRKIVDTGRRNIFSSCCELAWPMPAALRDELASRESRPLRRHPSRSLPSSPSSPRRVAGLPLLAPAASPAPPTCIPSAGKASVFPSKSQDDWALSKMRCAASTPPLIRRGSCESGFFSVSDVERMSAASDLSPELSLSLDDASSRFGSDIDDALCSWNLFRRSPSTFTDSSEDLTTENLDAKIGEKDIRNLVEYFERHSLSSRKNEAPKHTGQRTRTPCRVQKTFTTSTTAATTPKNPSLQRLRVCEGTVRSKVQLFDKAKAKVDDC